MKSKMTKLVILINSIFISSSLLATEMSVSSPPVSESSSLPVIPQSVKQNIENNQALKEAFRQTNNLTPEMIREARRIFNETEKAKQDDLLTKPISVDRTIPIYLGASKQQDVIRLAVNHNTIISIIDNAGKPWNVFNSTIGSDRDFALSRLDGDKGSMFQVYPKTLKGLSNITFILQEGLSSNVKIPVVFDIVTGQKEYDRQVTIRVQGLGPNSQDIDTPYALTQGVDSKYNAWLEGVVPSGVKKLKTNDDKTLAWQEKDGSIIIKTPYYLHSPNYTMALGSSDGTQTLYKLSHKSSVILVRNTFTNERKRISISGFSGY